MKRSVTPTFTLTIPLVVGPGEDRFLISCMEAGRRLYNATLEEMLRRYALMKQSKAWQRAMGITKAEARSNEIKCLLSKFGFTPAAATTFARKCKNNAGWVDRIGSNVAQRIAERAFLAVREYSFGKRGRPRFKGVNRPRRSLEGINNKANIIWKPQVGCVEFGKLTLRALLPSRAMDPYLHQALTNKTKYCRIIWRKKKGIRRWYLQLLQEGVPPPKHAWAVEGVVGLDIGPSDVAIVGENSASLVRLCKSVVHPWGAVRRLQRAMWRSWRATNPHCFDGGGRLKKGCVIKVSKRCARLRSKHTEIGAKLAVERRRAHGELINQILKLGNTIQAETLSYLAFQKRYGKSVNVRGPGMFIRQLRRKAESAGGKLIDLHTRSLKLSQYDHISETFTKKPLSQRWHALSDGSGVVQRDVYSAFLARCVIDNQHHPSHIEKMWAAQKPALLQAGWLRDKPAKIEPSGKIAVAVVTPAPAERVACKRGLAVGHIQDAVVARREPGNPGGFAPGISR